MDKKTLIKNSNLNNSKDVQVVNRNASFWIPLSLMIPAIIFFLIWTIIPLISVFKDSVTEFENPNYASSFGQVWSDPDWWASMKNSLLYAIITVPISLIISVTIAYALSNVIKKKLRGVFESIFFLPYVTSSIAISLTFVHLFNTDYGIINWILGSENMWLTTFYDQGILGLLAISIFGIWHSLAFQILILTTAMLSIDRRMYDSAAIDGASGKSTFFSIALPAVSNTIWYLFTIGLIGALKVYPIALFETSTNAMQYGPTLLMYVYDALAGAHPDYAKAGASSISLIFVVLTFNFLVKRLVNGAQVTYSKMKQNSIESQIEQSKIINLRSSSTQNYNDEIRKKIDSLKKDIKGKGK